ncbi:precorrin-4 C(11)-methyltransferase, partial [Corynebacterium diphtheriae]
MYAGSIVPPEVLESVPQIAEVINTACLSRDQIMEIIVAAHINGLDGA